MKKIANNSWKTIKINRISPRARITFSVGFVRQVTFWSVSYSNCQTIRCVSRLADVKRSSPTIHPNSIICPDAVICLRSASHLDSLVNCGVALVFPSPRQWACVVLAHSGSRWDFSRRSICRRTAGLRFLRLSRLTPGFVGLTPDFVGAGMSKANWDGAPQWRPSHQC